MKEVGVNIHIKQGDSVKFDAFLSKTARGNDCCYVDLSVGGSVITVFFGTPDELVAFCKAHNIVVKDMRNV